MKKILQLIMVLFVSCVTYAQTTYTVDGINYTVTNDSTFEVQCNGYDFPDGDGVDAPVIPEDIVVVGSIDPFPGSGLIYTVTSIGNGAFSGSKDGLGTNANIANQVIKTVTLPASVKQIDAHAFRNLPSLTTINLENIEVTGSNTFTDSGALQNVDLSSIVDLTTYTFVRNDAITELNLPSSLTTIGRGAMFDMDGLGAINIPSSVTSIDQDFMRRCDALTAVQFNWIDPSVVTFNATQYFGDLDPANITLYVPVGTKTDYESSAFNLTGVTIVEGVLPTTFVGQVFSDQGVSYQVTSLSPNEVTVNGATVANVVVGETATNGTDVFNVTAITAGSFQGNTVIETVELPSVITEIGTNTFRLCPNLTSLDTEHIQIIGGNILRQSPNVTTLDLSSVVTMQDNALGRAYGLTGVFDLPNIETMGRWCFVFAQGVSEVKLGSKLTSVAADTFFGMPSLQTVNVEAVTPPVSDGDFNPGSTSDRNEDTLPTPDFNNVTLVVPDGTVSAYEVATGWQVFGTTTTLSIEDILAGTLDINVSSDAITVNSSSTFKNATLSIYDITGRLLVSEAVNGASASVDISSLVSGIYIVKVAEGNAELVKRFAK